MACMHTIYSVAVLAREHQAQEEKKKVSGGISSEWDHMQDKVTYGGFHDSSEEIYSMLVPLPKLHQIITVLPSQLQQYPHLYNKHLKHCNTLKVLLYRESSAWIGISYSTHWNREVNKKKWLQIKSKCEQIKTNEMHTMRRTLEYKINQIHRWPYLEKSAQPCIVKSINHTCHNVCADYMHLHVRITTCSAHLNSRWRYHMYRTYCNICLMYLWF